MDERNFVTRNKGLDTKVDITIHDLNLDEALAFTKQLAQLFKGLTI